MMAGLITNGYFLVPKRIEALNAAGLDFLQISIDNLEPDEVSKKSLRLLDKKLEHLREHATFDVNINSVLGGGIKNPEDARTINNRARELGFSTSIGIIHDGRGRLKPLAAARAQSVRRGLGRDQRSRPGDQEPVFGDSQLPGQPGGRKAERRGAAAPARAISTSAKTAWCTTARSSAAIRACRWRRTRPTTSAASSRRRSRARPSARSAACTACRRWTSGDRRSTSRSLVTSLAVGHDSPND